MKVVVVSQRRNAFLSVADLSSPVPYQVIVTTEWVGCHSECMGGLWRQANETDLVTQHSPLNIQHMNVIIAVA